MGLQVSCANCNCIRHDLFEITTNPKKGHTTGETVLFENNTPPRNGKIIQNQSSIDLLFLIIKLQAGFRKYRLRKKQKKEELEKTGQIKSNIHVVDIEEFNNDRWDRFFSKVTGGIGDYDVPEIITKYYDSLFHGFEKHIKVFSLKIEDFELEESEDFLTRFKIPILKYISYSFNLGQYDSYFENITIYDEGLLDNVDNAIGTSYQERKVINKDKHSNVMQSQFSLRQPEISPLRKGHSELNLKESDEGPFLLKGISAQINHKKVSFKTIDGFHQTIRPIIEDRDKLPMIFSKEFNKEELDKANKLITPGNNNLLEKLNNQRLGKGTPRKERIDHWIYSFKYILDEIQRNDKENVTEEKIILNKNDNTYYKGTFHCIFEEKYGFGIQYMINKNFGKMYKYKGFFFKDKFHGYGILQGEGGYLYYGEFRNGIKCGYGYEESDEGIYTGLFNNNVYQGYGEFESKNKKFKYRGCYDRGNKEGLGSLDYEDGSKYVGNFKQNQMSGTGFFVWHQGHKYYGSWKADKMHGRGKYVWTTGDIYIGPYENDKKHGEGVYIYSQNGAELRGMWKNGNKEGKFMLKEGKKQSFMLKFRKDQQIE